MSKNFTRFMAFLMSLLMIVTVLPAEYLLSYAMETDKNTLSFVKTEDTDISYSDNDTKMQIKADSYKKDYELKYQFNYAIDYSTKESYAPGEMVYVMPSLGFYDNGVTAGYIFPEHMSLNNNNNDIWSAERTKIGNSEVIKITNTVTLTKEVVTEGYMQFAATINPRTQLLGTVTLNSIVMIMSEDGSNTNVTSNQLGWGYTLVSDEFEITEEVKDVQVENANELGDDANDFYWAKYEVNVSTEDNLLHSLPANNFKVNMLLENGASLYSVNGDKNVKSENNKFTYDFNVADWNYTQAIGPKTLSIIVKYPKTNFDGSQVTNNVSLDVQYIGNDNYQEMASASIKHELHDYDVKYDGDLFAVQTDKNAGYEISWNSLNRGKASPFSFYLSGLSRYNGEYSATFTDDALEILTTDGFYRLSKDEYAFNKVIINDLTHFTNSVGEQYTTLDFAIISNGNIVKQGVVGNNSQTFVLPEGSTDVSVAFYDLNSSLYLDATAIQVIGAIDLKDSSKVIKEGELRNLVYLLAIDNNDNIMNTVDASNYTGSDADRLAQADLDDYEMYLQRDITSQVVTNKSSQINVTTTFKPSTSVYNETTKNQESTLDITTFFASPGEVSSFSIYDILPTDMKFSGDISFSSDADLHLADGTIITKDEVNTFLNKYATVTTIKDYKSSGRTYIEVKFNFEKGKEVCYDSTLTNDFTSGKITTSLVITVPNKDAVYNNIVGMIFHDEHHETILKTKDDGNASIVSKDSILWLDIDNDGNVEELIDYANANLTSVYVKADNIPEEKTPSIKIEKTSDKEVYKNGEIIVYTIKVTNNGETPLTNVVITDDKATGTFDNQNGITVNKNVATISKMEIGETKTLTFKYTVPSNSKDGDIIKNTVTVTTNEKVTDTDDKDVTIKVDEVKTPSVKIEKDSDKEVYKNGEIIVYTIKVTNNGETPLTNVVITDDKATGTFDNQNGITVNKNVATISKMEIGETKTLTFKYAVPSNSKDGDIIKNTVIVTTNEKVTDTDDKDVTIKVDEVKRPSVKIEKDSDKTVYKKGETIVYTIKVTNNGETPLTNVVITDDKATGTFDNQNGITVNKNVATISKMEIGETKTLTFKYAVPSNSKDGDIIKNTVTVTTNEKVTDTDDKDVTIKVDEVKRPSVKIQKDSDKEVYKKGETIIYTIKVTNNGEIPLNNVVITESLNGIFYKDYGFSVKNNTATINTLNVGESKTLTFTYLVPSSSKDGDIIKNTVKVKTDENVYDEDRKDVTVKVPSVIVEKPSIEVVKTADKDTYNPEDTITYTIKVTNDGNIDLEDVKVIETLNGKWKQVSSNVRIVDDKNAVIKKLQVGETETLTFTYIVPKDAKNNSSIKNIVKAEEKEYNLKDDDDVTITIIEKEKPQLEITKTADKKSVKVGDTITYIITIKNTGNVDLKNVNLVDSLTDGKFADYDGVTKVNDYTLIIPILKVGDSKSYTFKYTVKENYTAKDVTNIATAIETTHNLRVEDKVVVEVTKPIIEKIPEIVQTGDNTPIFIFLGLAILSLIGMCVITKFSRKRK